MKKIISLLTLTFFLFAACQEQQSLLVTPENDSQATQVTEPNWITLPEFNNASVENTFSTTKLVNGKDETLLDVWGGYSGGIHYYVSANANLRFLRNSFEGTRQITMSIDTEYGSAKFSPSGTFDKAAIYNATFQGLDLRGVDPDEVRFVYMAADGSYVDAECDQIFVEIQSGKLQVINAKLPHFSRYGFVK